MPSRSDLAKIHIAKHDLGLDDATYRAILQDRFHLDSAAELSEDQAAELIGIFRRKGWRPVSAGQRGLIHVLWRKLAAAGAVQHGDDDALQAFIAHHTERHGLEDLTVHEASRVIEMLKNWLERTEAGKHRH